MISHIWKNIKIIIAIILKVSRQQPLVSIFTFSQKYSRFNIYRWTKTRNMPEPKRLDVNEVKYKVTFYDINYPVEQVNKKYVRAFVPDDNLIIAKLQKLSGINNDNIRIYIRNLQFYEDIKSKLTPVGEYTFQIYSQDIAFPRFHRRYIVDEKVEDDPPAVTQRTATPRQKPPKYKPSIRIPVTTQRTRSAHRIEADSSRERSFPIHVHVTLLRRNRCRVSLLPSRTADLDEEIEVNGPNGMEAWSACQDEWFSDIYPANIGLLLEKGGEWEALHKGEIQLRWVLSSREIYVLAPSSTISAFVSAPRLILGEDHVVLCTKLQKNFVKDALTNARCSEPSVISGNNGVPTGWVLFHSVCPTCPVEHEKEAGIFNILRPIHDLEIILKGGIRITHSIWINGYPPQICIRGAMDDKIEVKIDGKVALADANGNYTVENWDSPGRHQVFCGGVTQSYELVDGLHEWEGFEAFSYCPTPEKIGGKYLSICGPIVAVNDGTSEAVLNPSCNALLLGATPGQLAIYPWQYDTRASEYLAIADFPVTWTLPANPFQCDKSISYVKLVSAKGVESAHNSTFSRDEILQWSYAILNASRRRLRIEPDTGKAKMIWAEYKKVARRLWRKLR